MKKVLCTLLAAALAVSMSVSAFATSDEAYVPGYNDYLLAQTYVSGSTTYAVSKMEAGSRVNMIGAYIYIFNAGGSRVDNEPGYLYNTASVTTKLAGLPPRGYYAENDHKVRDANGETTHCWTYYDY